MNLDTSDFYVVIWVQAGMRHSKQFPRYEGAETFIKGLRNNRKVETILLRKSIAVDLIRK